MRGKRDALAPWRGKKSGASNWLLTGEYLRLLNPHSPSSLFISRDEWRCRVRDQNPIRTARRQVLQKERESRGLSVAPCVFCIQDHHTAGRNHDSQLTAPVCEMHHREIHEELLRGGVSLQFEPDTRKRIAQALRASAVYDRKRADATERWANLGGKSGRESR